MIYLISRHPGAIEWCNQKGISVDCIVPHLDERLIHTNDVVIGTLPIQIAAQIQGRGARYLHLSLEIPLAWRGQELTCHQMVQAGARLQEFKIHQVKPDESD